MWWSLWLSSSSLIGSLVLQNALNMQLQLLSIKEGRLGLVPESNDGFGRQPRRRLGRQRFGGQQVSFQKGAPLIIATFQQGQDLLDTDMIQVEGTDGRHAHAEGSMMATAVQTQESAITDRRPRRVSRATIDTAVIAGHALDQGGTSRRKSTQIGGRGNTGLRGRRRHQVRSMDGLAVPQFLNFGPGQLHQRQASRSARQKGGFLGGRTHHHGLVLFVRLKGITRLIVFRKGRMQQGPLPPGARRPCGCRVAFLRCHGRFFFTMALVGDCCNPRVCETVPEFWLRNQFVLKRSIGNRNKRQQQQQDWNKPTTTGRDFGVSNIFGDHKFFVPTRHTIHTKFGVPSLDGTSSRPGRLMTIQTTTTTTTL